MEDNNNNQWKTSTTPTCKGTTMFQSPHQHNNQCNLHVNLPRSHILNLARHMYHTWHPPAFMALHRPLSPRLEPSIFNFKVQTKMLVSLHFSLHSLDNTDSNYPKHCRSTILRCGSRKHSQWDQINLYKASNKTSF